MTFTMNVKMLSIMWFSGFAPSKHPMCSDFCLMARIKVSCKYRKIFLQMQPPSHIITPHCFANFLKFAIFARKKGT